MGNWYGIFYGNAPHTLVFSKIGLIDKMSGLAKCLWIFYWPIKADTSEFIEKLKLREKF